MRKIIKKILLLVGIEPKKVLKFYRNLAGNVVVYNVNKTNYEKNALIQYIVQPFMENNRGENSHQNQWQVKVLADEIGKLNYNVDVRAIDDHASRLKNNYDLVLDIHPGFNDTYKGNMNPGCIRIAYLTGMNPSVANQNEQNRLDALALRKGIILPPERQTQPVSRDVEEFDAFFYIGNAYNIESYSEFVLPPVYFIKNNGYEFPSLGSYGKKAPHKFLFFASSGQVHKGLDLLLDIFSKQGFPFDLYVCSGFCAEREFCEAYEKELFHTSNIHAVGFVDIMGKDFLEIVEKCSFVLLPSCSEGIAGSILTAMSAGVIPIVSKECGFEDDEVIHLQDCEPETIEEAVRFYSMKDISWIQVESERVRKIVQERYSRECFVQSVREALWQVVGDIK